MEHPRGAGGRKPPRHDPKNRVTAVPRDAPARLRAAKLPDNHQKKAIALLGKVGGEIYTVQRETARDLPTRTEQKAALKSLAGRMGEVVAAIDGERYAEAASAASAAAREYANADVRTQPRVSKVAWDTFEREPEWIFKVLQEEPLRATHPTQLVELQNMAEKFELGLLKALKDVKFKVVRTNQALTRPVGKIVRFLRRNKLPIEDFSWESDTSGRRNESLLVTLVRLALETAGVRSDPRNWIRKYKTMSNHGITSKRK